MTDASSSNTSTTSIGDDIAVDHNLIDRFQIAFTAQIDTTGSAIIARNFCVFPAAGYSNIA